MLTTLEGTYRDGRVEFTETPPLGAKGRVLVTFLQNGDHEDAPAPAEKRMIRFGMFPELAAITDEDFRAAEYNDETDLKLAGS